MMMGIFVVVFDNVSKVMGVLFTELWIRVRVVEGGPVRNTNSNHTFTLRDRSSVLGGGLRPSFLRNCLVGSLNRIKW